MSVAIISLGGKQYTVMPGKIVDAPHLNEEVGATLDLKDMLSGKKVTAKVLEQTKGDKLRVVKFKNKVRYTRTIGHRDLITKVKVEAIEA